MLAPLDNSVVFKKLFTDREVLQAFVKDVTGATIDPVTIETEKSFAPPVGAIDIKMDIFADDPAHRLIVEIQRVRYDYHYDRFLYYHHAAIMELQRSHTQYLLGKTVYTIVWLTGKDDALPKDLIVTSLQSLASDGAVVPLYPHKLFFLNPNYRSDQTPAAICDWLELVFESIAHPEQPHLNTTRSIIRKATSLIESDGLTPTERRIAMEEQGYEDHLALHERKGRAEGLAEGLAAGRLKIAAAMLAEGLETALISKVTGLPGEAIWALQQRETI